MRYIEQSINLFSLTNEYMLVHCVSSDYALGAGIAKKFRDRYDLATKLQNTGIHGWNDNGYCVIVNMDDNALSTNPGDATHRVANLVTKEKFWHKPTIRTIRESLIDLREQLEDLYEYQNVRRLGMPKIASGLDKQDWEQVRLTIISVFKSMSIDIHVCTNKKDTVNLWL